MLFLYTIAFTVILIAAHCMLDYILTWIFGKKGAPAILAFTYFILTAYFLALRMA